MSREMNTGKKGFLVGLISTALLAGLSGHAVAQTSTTATVTSLTTFTSTGSSFTGTFTGAGGTFPTATNYTLNYSGETIAITSFTTGTGIGAQVYNPLAYTGTITTTLQRFSSTAGTNQNNNIIYQRVTAQSGTTYTLAGPFTPLQNDLFNSNNLNAGTDNLFTNTGNGSGNNNNIERVDVVFDLGLTVTDALAFLLLERGATTGHDGFQIAAILSVDAFGAPTSYGSLVSFATGSYGTTALSGTSNWLVARNLASEPDFGAEHPSAAVTAQPIGGTTISVSGLTSNRGLGIASGTTIYGYSLFGVDVTGTTSSELLDISSSFFPKNTSETNGGIDLITYTGVAVQAVPEPGVLGLLGLAGLAGLAAWRKRRGSPTRD